MEGERKFCFVFIIHFVCTLSFQYKLNYHTSLFYCNFLFIFSCCPTRFFSSAILLFLFSFFFVNLMNICKWIVPLIVYYMEIRKSTVRFAHVSFKFILLYLFLLTFAIRLKDANCRSYWNILAFCHQWKMMSDLNMSH